MTTNTANLRINKEIEELQNLIKERTFLLEMKQVMVYQIQLCINGPSDTPYNQFLYFLDVQFPKEYPFLPPQVTFLNKIFHPNINLLGYICLDILQNEWTPTCTIKKVLSEIQYILRHPVIDSPYFPDAAILYGLEDKTQFEKKATEWGSKYAIYFSPQ